MPSCFVFYLFLGKLDVDLSVKVIGTWVIERALMGCTLVPSMKSVGECPSRLDQFFGLLQIFWENLTLNFDLDLESRSSALRSLNAPY